MQNQNLCERSVSEKAMIQILKIKIQDLESELKEKDSKIERLENKINYLNRCLTSVESDKLELAPYLSVRSTAHMGKQIGE